METIKFESADDIRVHKGAFKFLICIVNYIIKFLEDAKVNNDISNYTINYKAIGLGYEFLAYTTGSGVSDYIFAIDIKAMQNRDKLRIKFDINGIMNYIDISLLESNDINKAKITNIIEKCIIKSEVNNNKVLEGVC